MLWLKVLFIIVCLVIALQDVKEKQVYVLSFVVLAFTGGIIQYKQTYISLFLLEVGLNFILFVLISLSIAIYCRLKGIELFDAIGLGDFLMWMVFVISFSTQQFVWIMTGSLIFSLLVVVWKHYRNTAEKHIPLAGYQAFFVMLYTMVDIF